MRLIALILLATSYVLPAAAQLPQGRMSHAEWHEEDGPRDPNLAQWFRSLRQPGTNESCCSIADCKPTDFRTKDGHYQAMVDGAWQDVPMDVVLRRADNPIGRAVVCYTPHRGIMCFIKGPEA